VRVVELDRGVARVVRLEDVADVVGHPAECRRSRGIVAGPMRDQRLVIELADPVDGATAVALLVEDVLIGGPEDLVRVVAGQKGGVDVEPGRRAVAEHLECLADDPVMCPVAVAEVAAVAPRQRRHGRARQEGETQHERGERTTAATRHDGRLREAGGLVRSSDMPIPRQPAGSSHRPLADVTTRRWAHR
jgi:hypothetical protein